MTRESKVRGRLLQACYSFLVPIARVLLMNGIGFREFSDLCRVAFVEVASKEYGIRGRPTNNSRVSAMTGIARKDIAKVRSLVDAYKADPRVKLSPLSDLLHRWYTDPRFQDTSGKPRPLPTKGDLSFDSLARSCVGDVPASAIKAELLRHGSIAVTEDDLVVVRRREVVPKLFDEKLLTSLSFNLRALAETIAFNSNPQRNGPGRIERYVESDSISVESRVALRSVVRSKVTSFTEELDDLFSQCERTLDTRENNRIAVGVFYHEDD